MELDPEVPEDYKFLIRQEISQEEREKFKPRQYQDDLIERCYARNTIVNLPTGSGKTYIAIRVIKKFKQSLEKPLGEGGKRTFVLVNNVPLVKQHQDLINVWVTHAVSGYSSEDRVDLWDKKKWDGEIKRNKVLVMTGQILLDMLNHTYVKLQDINLIIFDECHHAVDDHPMRVIMRQFEHCPKEDQPRVIGLSATLLNRNVAVTSIESSIRGLETTFHATIATANDIGEVAEFSTSPMEAIVAYEAYVPCAAAERAIRVLQELSGIVMQCRLPSAHAAVAAAEHKLSPNQRNVTRDPMATPKAIARIIVLAQNCIRKMGMYGGSLGITAYTIVLERLKRTADKDTALFYKMVITHFTVAKAILESAMDSDLPRHEKILKHSSDQLRKMLDVLKEYDEKKLQSGSLFTINRKLQKLNAIIFVRERFMCKILYNLLKDVRESDPEEYGFLKHDFIVGLNVNPYNDTREQLFEKKYSQSALIKFRNRTLNCLIATSVIEEGVDVPQCSLVLRFDEPVEYRSYVQSKGRARMKSASYVMLTSRSDYSKFKGKYFTFQSMEQEVYKILSGNPDSRLDPSDEDIDGELYQQNDVKPFILPNGARVTATSAVSLLARYCSMLPRDQFTYISSNWIMETSTVSGENCVRMIVTMPITCPIKEPIYGEFKTNLKSAKRSAALNTCIKLYQAGELDGNLLPKKYERVDFDMPEVKALFKNWPTDETKLADLPKPGTMKRKRKHPIIYPACLEGPGDWSSPEKKIKKFHIHLIDMTPDFPKPQDSREAALYDLLLRKEGYALMTSNELPNLCDLSMFLSVGEVKTKVLVNHGTLLLNEQQFNDIKKFHFYLFDQILDIAKKFICAEDTSNSLYVVPTNADSLSLIAWDVIKSYEAIPPLDQPPDEERVNMTVRPEDYLHSVVTPWYRKILPTRYLVSKVVEHMTPRSMLGSDNSSTFEEYFRDRYNLQVMGPTHQPLLEVKNINSRMNCLLPRAATLNLKGKKLKYAMEAQGDDKLNSYVEYLVPEFCTRYEYPGILWYKATVLPSIIHRVTMLLKADELRAEIAKGMKIGCITLPQSLNWLPINADEEIAKNSLLAESNQLDRPAINSKDWINAENMAPEPRLSMRENLYTAQLKKLGTDFPWDESHEPVDIERNLSTATLMDIECYDEFCSTTLAEKAAPLAPKPPSKHEAILPPPHKPYASNIKLLAQGVSRVGAELKDVLAALTVIKSHDIFNLERFETLGDSFLKFIGSLYLFHKFPKMNEGQLTNVKSRLIGNRNLFYAGARKRLGGRMKAEGFAPRSDFVMPGYSVPERIAHLLKEHSLRPTFLIGIELSHDEIVSGELKSSTVDEIETRIKNGADGVEIETEADIQQPMQCYLKMQAISDKVVADCVEALVGAYLVNSGIVGGIKVLEWFNVIPPEHNVQAMLRQRPPTPLSLGLVDERDILHVLSDNRAPVEKIIGYTFNDPTFLLEALSHPSYISNRYTSSYERLEFLGDALLDFLITAHIYEKFGTLSPGKITDLRSALVNNVTFASYVVKLDLHRCILSMLNPALEHVIETFVQHQMNRGHEITEDVLYLIDEHDCKMSEYVQVPKVLSDIFESLAAAIYLDSGGDMATVWRVYSTIMHREIERFGADVPIQPARLLMETIHACPEFGPSYLVPIDRPTVMVPVTISVHGRRLKVYGFGGNKAQAKRAAAKMALANLS